MIEPRLQPRTLIPAGLHPSPVTHIDQGEEATATARRIGRSLVVSACPYCRNRHVHGAAGGLGRRQSHCAGGGQPYVLVAERP